MDTRGALETWTGKGAHEAAEQATREGTLHKIAQRYGQRLEARKVKEDHVRRGGAWVTVATWGVFLAEGQEGAQGAPGQRRKPHVTSS